MADDVSAPRPRPPEQLWHSTQATPASQQRRASKRRSRLIGLAALFLALLSFTILGFFYLRTRPPDVFFLTIAISDYDARQFPVCAFARQDGELLLARFPGGKQAITKDRDLLRNMLEELKDKSDEQVVIHLAALAIVRDGEVQVLPADADIDDPSSWRSVREIVKAIESCPAKHKLLILDLARPMADPQLGVLSDRVAASLEELFAANPPSFHVLCSSSAGQHSLTSTVLQNSVIAHYLNEGLLGQADLGDRRAVTVRELAEYVEKKVDGWAQANRGVRQQPRWFGKEAADFDLVKVQTDAVEPERARPSAYPDILKKGWEERDRLLSEAAAQRAPRLVARLNASLLRLEERWRGGALAKNEADALDRDTQTLLDDFKTALVVHHAPPRSAALVGAKDDPELSAEVGRGLLAVRPGADEKEQAKAAGELAKRLQPADPKSGSVATSVIAVIDALGKLEQVSPGQIAVANQAVGQVIGGQKPPPTFAEALCLRRLARYTKERDPAPPPKYLQAILQTMRAHESALAALDQAAECLPWVSPLLTAADVKRRGAERRLFWDLRSTWDAARDDLLAAKEEYERAVKIITALRIGREQLDRAYARLPGFLTQLCDWPEEDAALEKPWQDAAEDALALQTLFAAGPAADPFSGESAARSLRAGLDELERILDKRINRAVKDDTPKGERQMLCLLHSPLLLASKKLSVLDKERTQAEKLQAAAVAVEPERERDAAAARARMSLALLRLAGIEVDGKIAAMTRQGTLRPGDVAILESFLRAQWGKQMSRRWQAARPDPSGDRLNRLLPVFGQSPDASVLDRDLTFRLQRAQQAAFLRWLRDAYQAESDFWNAAMSDPQARGLIQEQDARDFYARAAQAVRP